MPSANAELIESYEQSPSSIAAALEGLTEAQLLQRPGSHIPPAEAGGLFASLM